MPKKSAKKRAASAKASAAISDAAPDANDDEDSDYINSGDDAGSENDDNSVQRPSLGTSSARVESDSQNARNAGASAFDLILEAAAESVPSTVDNASPQPSSAVPSHDDQAPPIHHGDKTARLEKLRSDTAAAEATANRARFLEKLRSDTLAAEVAAAAAAQDEANRQNAADDAEIAELEKRLAAAKLTTSASQLRVVSPPATGPPLAPLRPVEPHMLPAAPTQPQTFPPHSHEIGSFGSSAVHFPMAQNSAMLASSPAPKHSTPTMPQTRPLYAVDPAQFTSKLMVGTAAPHKLDKNLLDDFRKLPSSDADSSTNAYWMPRVLLPTVVKSEADVGKLGVALFHTSQMIRRQLLLLTTYLDDKLSRYDGMSLSTADSVKIKSFRDDGAVAGLFLEDMAARFSRFSLTLFVVLDTYREVSISLDSTPELQALAADLPNPANVSAPIAYARAFCQVLVDARISPLTPAVSEVLPKYYETLCALFPMWTGEGVDVLAGLQNFPSFSSIVSAGSSELLRSNRGDGGGGSGGGGGPSGGGGTPKGTGKQLFTWTSLFGRTRGYAARGTTADKNSTCFLCMGEHVSEHCKLAQNDTKFGYPPSHSGTLKQPAANWAKVCAAWNAKNPSSPVQLV